jgi:hypothetical protein
MLAKLSLPILVLAFASYLPAQKTAQPPPGDPNSGPVTDPSGQTGQYGGAQTPPNDDSGMRQSGTEAGQQIIQGTIARVDSIGNNLTIHTDNNQEETLAVDATTAILVNGKKATVADLKTGQLAAVAMEGQKAVRVEVSDRGSSNSSSSSSGR